MSLLSNAVCVMRKWITTFISLNKIEFLLVRWLEYDIIVNEYDSIKVKIHGKYTCNMFDL